MAKKLSFAAQIKKYRQERLAAVEVAKASVECTLKFAGWAKNGLERLYIKSADGADLGYIGVRANKRAAGNGYYEQHRAAKGEEFYNYSKDVTVSDTVLAEVDAVLIAYLGENEAHRLSEKFGEQFTYTYGDLG